MVLHVSKNSSSAEVEHISFPAETAKVRSSLTALEESGGYAPVHCIRGEGPAEILTGCVKRDDLFSEAGIQKLNQLAGLIDTMPPVSQKVFAGALRVESVKDLDDILTIAASLGQYELIEGVTCDKELGGWLVENGLAGVNFPKETWPYLDYHGIGAAYYADHSGTYTVNGYVRRREPEQTQKEEKKAAITLTLASPTASCRIGLPASDERLEAAKRALGLDSLENAVIGDVETSYPWAYLLPMDSITLEDANTLAECVQAMTKDELRTFGAALEVEGPNSFRAAGIIAMDIDDYELVTGSEEEYGREALRYAGAGDEIQEMLEGFTDFDALGRFEMKQDGVRETSYGSVKRLSAPFPSQEEIGPSMC